MFSNSPFSKCSIIQCLPPFFPKMVSSRIEGHLSLWPWGGSVDRDSFSMIWIGFQVTCTGDLEMQLVNLGFIFPFFLSLSVSCATCPVSYPQHGCSSPWSTCFCHFASWPCEVPWGSQWSYLPTSRPRMQRPWGPFQTEGGEGLREAQECQFWQLLCLTVLIHQCNRCNGSTLRGWLAHQGHLAKPSSYQAPHFEIREVESIAYVSDCLLPCLRLLPPLGQKDDRLPCPSGGTLVMSNLEHCSVPCLGKNPVFTSARTGSSYVHWCLKKRYYILVKYGF